MIEPQTFKDNERLAWDLCAEKYDECLTEPFRPFAERLLSLVSLEQGQTLLDVATGSGLVALMAAPLVGSNGEVIGVDLSPSMVRRADRRAQENKIPNARFLQMDAETLDFPDQSFDVAVCALGLMLFPQPDAALLEMHRVLKPGGTVGLSVFGRGSKVALRALMEPFIPLMPPPGERGPSIFGFGKGGTLRKSLEEAGFSSIQVEEEAHLLAFEQEERVWDMLLSLGRLGQMHACLAEGHRALLRNDVLSIARDTYLRPGRVFELPFQVMYATGVR